jgi:hypothetical protein
MKNTRNALLMSAAALIVGVGVAAAQAPSPAPAAQQAAPAEKMAPAQAPNGAAKTKTPDAGLKSGQADDKMGRKGDRAQHAQDAPKGDMKNGMSPETGREGGRAQHAQDAPKGDMKKGMSPETKSPGKTTSDMKNDAEPRMGNKTDTKTRERSSDKTGDSRPGTTGQGAAGGSATLSSEQRTTVRTVIQRQNVRPMTNVDFSISVGTQVPRTVQFHRVPAELVHIYPHWSGYDYFLVGDQIVVVNPRTHQIVAVLDA